MRNQKGFTLIEMLIVLTIISTLLILIVPNLADQNSKMQTKGCEALVSMAESQIQAYRIDTGEEPDSIQTLVTGGYMKKDTCANDSKVLTYSTTDGKVGYTDNIEPDTTTGTTAP